MPIDPLAQHGFLAATASEHGRPGCAPQSIERLASELGLQRSTRLLDLATGTGRLSQALAASHADAEHEQRLDRDGLVAQIASWSYIASLPDRERDALLQRARGLAPATCAVAWRTELYWTRRVSRGR